MSLPKDVSYCGECINCTSGKQPGCNTEQFNYRGPYYSNLNDAFNSYAVLENPILLDGFFISAPIQCGDSVSEIVIGWQILNPEITCIKNFKIERIIDNTSFLIATNDVNNTTIGVEIVNLTPFFNNYTYVFVDNSTRPGWSNLASNPPMCDFDYKITIESCSLVKNETSIFISQNMNINLYFGYYDAMFEPVSISSPYFTAKSFSNVINDINTPLGALLPGIIIDPLVNSRFYVLIPNNLIIGNNIEIKTSLDGISYYFDNSWQDTGNTLTDITGTYRVYRYYFTQGSAITIYPRVEIKKI